MANSPRYWIPLSWSACLDNMQHLHQRDTFHLCVTEVTSRGWGLVSFSQLPCQCPLPWPGIPAVWLPCPLIPSCWPCCPSTGAASWQCGCLCAGWNLSTCLAAHSRTGWWSLALLPSALVMVWVHRHPLLGELISLCISLYRELTDTSVGWFSGLTAVPVAGVWAAAVPAVRAVAALGAGAAVEPVALFLLSCCPPFPFRALNSVEQGSLGMGQTPVRL